MWSSTDRSDGSISFAACSFAMAILRAHATSNERSASRPQGGPEASFRRHGSGGCKLFLVDALQNKSCLDQPGVGIDVDLRGIRQDRHVALLRLEYRHILQKCSRNLPDQHIGERLIADVPIVGLAPEIVAGSL